MIRGRKETTPGEQLSELRKARDRYNALADQLRDDVDLLCQPDEKLARERDARRIAQAYEKSIENMVASCHSRRIDTHALQSGSVAVNFALAVFFVVVAGGAVLAVTRPAIPRAIVARIMGIAAAPAAPNTPSRPAIAGTAAQMPVPGKDAPANTSSMPKPNARSAADRHPVVHASPPVRAAERVRKNRQSVKAAAGDAGGGNRFVVKVLQPDGSLKEESFSSGPSH